MTRDYIDLGPAPAEEECAQLGKDGYQRLASIECRAYIDYIRRIMGPEPDGANLAIKANPHDYGTYYSVVCYFDIDNPWNQQPSGYALKCESEMPNKWDDLARERIRNELASLSSKD